jgi:hypothetical protein
MAHAKRASQRKGLRKAIPVLGAAGLSLAMGGGASATTSPTANVPSQDTWPRPVITLNEEEISDVSLATFYVFDRENESQLGQGIRLAAHCSRCGCSCRVAARCGCHRCGCAGFAFRRCGCGGCGCGGCGCCWW